MENIGEKLRAAVLERIQVEREVRDDMEVRVKRLEDALEESEGKVEELRQKAVTLNAEVADLIAEGVDPAKKANKLRTTRGEIEDVQGLIDQIKGTSLPEAKEMLKEAQDALTRAAKNAILVEQEAYTGKMAEHARLLMQIYDGIISGQREVFEELRLLSLAGTMELAPKIKAPELWRYCQNVGLGLLEKP